MVDGLTAYQAQQCNNKYGINYHTMYKNAGEYLHTQRTHARTHAHAAGALAPASNIRRCSGEIQTTSYIDVKR